MQCGGAAQKYGGIRLLIGVGPRGLATSRCGGQGRYAQELNRFPVPLLVDLMPMLPLVVGAKEGSIAIQRQLRAFHFQLAHRCESAGQRRRGRGCGNLRMGQITTARCDDAERQQSSLERAPEGMAEESHTQKLIGHRKTRNAPSVAVIARLRSEERGSKTTYLPCHQ